MPSFSQLTLLAAVAFSALSLAVPIVAPIAASKRDVVALPEILTQLVTDLIPVTNLIHDSDVTEEAIAPLANQVQSIISAAVTEVNALASTLTDPLATADGVISVAEATDLLAPVLTIVYSTLGSVLTVADGTPVGDALQPIINAASGALGPLLDSVDPLVEGLLSAVAPLVAPLVGNLDSLGLDPVVASLGSIVSVI